MPFRSALKLYRKAVSEEEKEELYRFWLVRYPMYTVDNYETFSEFCEKLRPTRATYDLRPKDEIMKEILELQERS